MWALTIIPPDKVLTILVIQTTFEMVTSQMRLRSIRSYLNSLLHFRSGWLVTFSTVEMFRSRSGFCCRIHLWFRLMGGLYGKSMTSPRQIPGSPSRLRAQHRKLTAMRYYGNVMRTTIWRLRILHLQQYSRSLNLFNCFFFLFFLSVVISDIHV